MRLSTRSVTTRATSGKVFVRHSRGVELTERGTALFRQAQGIDAQIAALLRRQGGPGTSLSGTVRISVNEPIGIFVLPEWIGQLRQGHPELDLELVIDNRATDLSRRDADIAVRMFRPSQPNLVAKKVGDVALGLFAHRGYLKHHGTPKTASDMRRHTFLGMDGDPQWQQQIAALGLAREQFRVRSDNLALHWHALLRGVGIAGAHLALAHRQSDLIRVLEHIPLPSLAMWLVVHEELRHEPAIAVALASLHEFLSDYVRQSETTRT